MPLGVYPGNHGGWPKRRFCPVCGCEMVKDISHNGRWSCPNDPEECSLISCKWARSKEGKNLVPKDFIFEGITVLPLKYLGRI